ncbi:hypothetical protein BU23DRAFT_555047 [Bimuria novae-zelandiae CBS 107.79]|uniref:Uncharacterized protein n=3 Tax=Bimuria novae-zelandiae CBS 107.79 TaxID=1447943 RepID=A0A6A5V6N8_9PLEO|nr:hypothetical protein BU23DRAFT_555047 [Bimuria novae-zelandiae CBS 107.79]
MDQFVTRSHSSQSTQSTQSTRLAFDSYHHAGSRTAAVMAMAESFESLDDSPSEVESVAPTHEFPGELKASGARFPIVWTRLWQGKRLLNHVVKKDAGQNIQLVDGSQFLDYNTNLLPN